MKLPILYAKMNMVLIKNNYHLERTRLIMKHLTTKDLMTAGIFSALYFLAIGLVTFICMFTLPVLGNFLLPAVAALTTGSIYFLLLKQVPKFGAITIFSLVMGTFLLLSGHFPLAIIANLGFSGLADWFTYRTTFQTKHKSLLGYILFSYGLTGPLLPLWFMKQQYIDNLTSRGKTATYISGMFQYVTPTFFILLMFFILIGAILGGIYGQKLVAKHFSQTSSKQISDLYD